MEISEQIRHRLEGVNVPTLERILTIGAGAIGAGLGIYAAITGSTRAVTIGGAVAALGAGLIARGVTGRCPAYRALARRDDAADTNHKPAVPDFHGAGATTRQGVRDLDHFH